MSESVQHPDSPNPLNEPPDISPMQIDDHPPTISSASFLQTLLSNTSLSIDTIISPCETSIVDLSDESLLTHNEEDIFVPILAKDQCRLYFPWKYSIIIKVFGRKIAHQLLKNN